MFLLSLGDSEDKSLSQPENINTAILTPVKYPILLFFIISPLSQNALPHSETVKKILQVDSEAKASVSKTVSGMVLLLLTFETEAFASEPRIFIPTAMNREKHRNRRLWSRLRRQSLDGINPTVQVSKMSNTCFLSFGKSITEKNPIKLCIIALQEAESLIV